MPNPRFPVYIPSKSRADIALTPHVLDRLGVPWRLVVEEQQVDDYARRFPRERLLILDPRYIEEYDACMDLKPGQSKGSGPARNFIWDHAISEGAEWHWIMDDNIAHFARLHRNERIPVGDGTIFAAMEDFCLRYKGVALAAPHYWMFAPSRARRPPFVTGSRVMSCILIRNDIPFRWRARYNEDIDLSLRVLKGGWQTILFNAFLQCKVTTQTMPGGNTEAFYADEGTLAKSQMLADLHPDVARVAWRYGRWHHYVDYSQWRNKPLVRRDDYEPPAENPYRLKKRPIKRAHWGPTHDVTRARDKGSPPPAEEG